MKTSIQITKEKQEEFIKQLANKAIEEFIAKTKAATDTGTFKMVISDDTMDRQGDMVDQAGFDIENYMKNPVVLWGHDYFSVPIGITDRIYREGNKTVAEGRFAPTEEGQEFRKYYEAGMPCAASIGYIPKEGEGGKVTGLELLEWSFVAIPANPNCISADEARMHNFNVEFLVTKGLIKIVEKKEEAEGDPCDMDDGTPGVMAKKPDGEGLVCVPAKDGKGISAGDDDDDVTNPGKDELDQRLREDMKAEHKMHHDVMKAILEKHVKGIREECWKDMESEHERHEKCVAKLIDDYTEKVDVQDPDGEKSMKSGAEISGKNKEKLKKLHEHSKAIDEHTKAQRDVIEGMLKPGNDEGDGEKEIKAPEQKSEASSSATDVDDYIRVTNILKENLKAVVTLSNETLRGIKQAEKRIKK
jgi:hypothetical protein